MTQVVPFARYEAGQSSPYHADPPAAHHPDYELSVAHTRLRNWAHQLADNSSIINAVLSSRVANAIGPGLSYEPLTRDRQGRLLTELNDALRRRHERWSADCDTSGELSRAELERQAWRSWDLEGEAFARRVDQRMTRDPRELPYHVQLLPAAWVPMHLTGLFDNQRLVHGIEKNEWGRVLRYYVAPDALDYATAPGVFLDPRRMLSLPADQVWHLKRVRKVGQTRGVTLFHPVMFRVADITEFQEAHRLAARASADLYASINRSPDAEVPASERETNARGTEQRRWDFEHLQMIDGLAPGESVNFHSPEHPNQNAVDFVREELRAIASACDVGFSQIAQVFDSSYAAQRLEVVDTWRKVARDRGQFVNDFAKPALWDRFVEIARLSGQLPARALRRVDPETLFDVRIDGPTMPVIDPVKDRQAFALDRDHDWDSRHGIIRKMGRRPADVDAEVAADPLRARDPAAPPTEPEEDDDA